MIEDQRTALTRLRDSLNDRTPTFGSWLQLPSPDVAEIMAASGFDWLVADLEHGGIDRSALVQLVRAIETKGSIPLARIMACDPLLSRQALDAGCAGVIIPHVDDPIVYSDFVSRSTWPPAGQRSIGFFRANDYGLNFDQYSKQAQSPILIPMVESRKGVENLAGVLNAGRADAVLIGPYDLSASIGDPGNFESAEYLKAEDHVIRTCAELGITAGVHDVIPTSDSIRRNLARGYTFIACGMDSVFLSRAVLQVTSMEEVRSGARR